MEQIKLPNATISLVLGILSFIGCCCFNGFGGVVLSGVALYLARKDEKTYAANPEGYSNYSQVKTAKTIAIVGLIISALVSITVIYFMITGEYYDFRDNLQNWAEEMQRNQ